MRFGIFDHLERRHDVDLAQQYEERLQLMAQADRAGIHGYHIAEHHHSPLCLAPNQSVFLAAAAERTERLRIGTLVYVLPLHHPVRLLEETCMVDQLSNGRVQVGVGRGAAGGRELALWGQDPADSEGLFRESLEILLRGYRNEFLDFEGEHYQLRNLWMALRPVQRPHPALWYAGNPRHAGELGMNFIGAGDIARTRRATEIYLEAWRLGQAEPGPCTSELADPLYGTMRHVFLADTDAEATDRAMAAYEEYRRHYAKPLPPGASPPPAAALPPGFRGPNSFTAAEAMENQSLLVGSPSTIRELVVEYARTTGANYWVGSFSWGDLTHQESSHSLRLFTDEVMPAVDQLRPVT